MGKLDGTKGADRTVKKEEVKPFIDANKKLIIDKLSHLTGVSIKAIGEDLCKHAIDSDFAIKLAPHFKRSIKIKNLQFPALDNPIPIPKTHDKEMKRISLMLSKPIYEYAHSLSYAIDLKVPKVIARMIEFSMDDEIFFNKYVLEYLSKKMDPDRKQLLKSILNDINGILDRNYTIAALLFYIADERKEIDVSIEDSVEDFASQWTATGS